MSICLFVSFMYLGIQGNDFGGFRGFYRLPFLSNICFMMLVDKVVSKLQFLLPFTFSFILPILRCRPVFSFVIYLRIQGYGFVKTLAFVGFGHKKSFGENPPGKFMLKISFGNFNIQLTEFRVKQKNRISCE